MLVNEFLSERRKTRRVVLREIVEAGTVPDHADAYAERDTLRSEIVRLPRRQQAVLALRYYSDLSDKEIAESLGCSAGTVRGYAARALQSLRVRMGAPPNGGRYDADRR
jgi:RNA polymerase sigma factor (sigma-70 family)